MKDAATTDQPRDVDGRPIVLHTPQDFEGLRRAGRLAAQTLDHIAPFVKPWSCRLGPPGLYEKMNGRRSR